MSRDVLSLSSSEVYYLAFFPMSVIRRCCTDFLWLLEGAVRDLESGNSSGLDTSTCADLGRALEDHLASLMLC